MRTLRFDRDVQGVAFHPAGGLLAADLGEWLSFHDLAAGAERLRVITPHGPVRLVGPRAPLTFSPDGRRLLRGGELLDLSECRDRLRAPGAAPGAVTLSRPRDLARLFPYAALSRDGRFAAAVGYDHPSRSDALEVWDVRGGRRLWRQPVPSHGGCRGVALAPDGQVVAALTGASVPLLDGSTGGEVARLEHGQPPHLAAFSPDGRLLATATGSRRRVWLWDVAGRRLLTQSRAFRQVLTALAFHPEGRLLAAGAVDGLIRLWDTASFREVAALNWKVGPVRALAFASDGMTAAAAGQKGAVVVWDVDEA